MGSKSLTYPLGIGPKKMEAKLGAVLLVCTSG